MVEELLAYSKVDIEDLDKLMHELSATSFCNVEILDAIVSDANSHAYVIREEEKIVAAGTLCVMHSLEFTLANIESVVVSSKYRGKGYGRRLVGHIISEAKRLRVKTIHLTSNPRRIEANALYQKMGFERYETNCYVQEIWRKENETVL